MGFIKYIGFLLAGMTGVFLGVLAMLFIQSESTILSALANDKIHLFNQTEFGNWAMWFGSLFGGIAATGAIAAAIFTRNTFKFLTKQHHDQQELQSIQMYQEHREAFNKLLADIESSLDDTVRFKNKVGLYQEIFCENSFNKVKTKVSINGTEKNTLFLAKKEWDELQDNLSRFDCDIKDALYQLERILDILHINIDSTHIGDIGSIFKTSRKKANTRKFIINCFNQEDTFKVIRFIFAHFYAFTGNKYTEAPTEKLNFPLDRTIDFACNTSESPFYTSDLEAVQHQHIKDIFLMYRVLCASSTGNDGDAALKELRAIIHTRTNRAEWKHLIDSVHKDLINEYFSICKCYWNRTDEELIELEERLRNYNYGRTTSKNPRNVRPVT